MSEILHTISAVERDTGIGKDTLRVWERRYDFPQPVRDAGGERLYPDAQLARLRLIRRLLDRGFRPGKVVGASAEALESLILASNPEAPAPDADHDALAALVEQIRVHNCEGLRQALQQRLLREGLQRFVTDTVAPLNERVGRAWFAGDLGVADEHMYSEQVQTLVRTALGQHAGLAGSPRVLLTTFPDEAHALGLLMVEAMLAPEGVYCVSLGTRTPVPDIAHAAHSGHFDIVALSFSSIFPVRSAIEGLASLRSALAPEIAIWAGGAGVPSARRLPSGVVRFDGIDATVDALTQWRQGHPRP